MTTGSVARGTRASRPRRLGSRTRKGVLMVHLMAAGSWLGIDVVMTVLVFTALLTDETGVQGLAYQALGLFAVWSLLIAGVVCLATGMLLGLGSQYGLVKYWWVAVKLVLNVVLLTLVLFALPSTVAAGVEYGQSLAGGTDGAPRPTTLLFPPIVATVILLTAFMLGIFKPGGRIRRAQGVRP